MKKMNDTCFEFFLKNKNKFQFSINGEIRIIGTTIIVAPNCCMLWIEGTDIKRNINKCKLKKILKSF